MQASDVGDGGLGVNGYRKPRPPAASRSHSPRSVFACQGADERQRFFNGAASRNEYRVAIITVGDVEDESSALLHATADPSISLTGPAG